MPQTSAHADRAVEPIEAIEASGAARSRLAAGWRRRPGDRRDPQGRRAFGLGAGVRTRDSLRADHFGRGVEAGRVWVNNHRADPADAGFAATSIRGSGAKPMMLDHPRQTRNMLVSYEPTKLGFF